MFKTKSPVPFIVVTIIVIIIGAVIMIATGGQGVEGHWNSNSSLPNEAIAKSNKRNRRTRGHSERKWPRTSFSRP